MVWCIEKIIIIPSLFNHFQRIASFIHLDLTRYWLPVEQQTAASPLLELIRWLYHLLFGMIGEVIVIIGSESATSPTTSL